MYARITRFTDCDADAIARVVEEIEERDGPPEGVPSTGLKLLVDEGAGTLIFLGLFETEEDLKAGDAVLQEMDPPGGALGTRSSVDLCEIKVEKQAG